MNQPPSISKKLLLAVEAFTTTLLLSTTVWFASATTQAVAQTDIITCYGRIATIIGTPESEDIVGTSGHDVIVTFGGRDRVHALDGDDIICGGPGPNTIIGGAGDDFLFGNGLYGATGRRNIDSGDGGPEIDTCVNVETVTNCEGLEKERDVKS